MPILRVNSTAEIPRRSRSFLGASTTLNAREASWEGGHILAKNALLTGNARSLKWNSMNETPCAIALMRLAVACLLLVNCHQADAQTTTEEWKAAAIKKYPTLNLNGSALNTKFLAAYNERIKTDPDFIKKPDWMMKLADELDPRPQASSFNDVAVPFNEKIEDTESFFEDYKSKRDVKPRDQFETQEEYEARLPKRMDPKKVFYFEISESASLSYDIDKQRMTLLAGNIDDAGKYLEISICTKNNKVGNHEASNAYGKKVTVEEINCKNFKLFFEDKKLIPQQFRADYEEKDNPLKVSNFFRHQLTMSVKLPREIGKDAAPHLAIVCGVQFIYIYKDSFFNLGWISKPTIENPLENAHFFYGIPAKLVSLNLINKNTKQQLAIWTR